MDTGVSLFELKFCGCGVCGRELLAPGPANVAAATSLYGGGQTPETVAGRRSAWGGLRLVPLCAWCLESGKVPAEPGVSG
ncbi:MAG TPA: hypothetical protein VM529_09480 [Gemmata sp.]|nr:hypothetical protein [Gemmata sp.]